MRLSHNTFLGRTVKGAHACRLLNGSCNVMCIWRVTLMWTDHDAPADNTKLIPAQPVSRLRQLGLQPRTKADADGRKFPFVLFAAPPSGSEDYPAEVCCLLP